MTRSNLRPGLPRIAARAVLLLLLATSCHAQNPPAPPASSSTSPASAHTVVPPTTGPSWTPRRPNIVLILCDDLGYGDVHAFNPQRGRIATPNIDRLAGQGMSFTDAHASSSVCTPSRYSILTGRYNWRTRLQSGSLEGESAPLIEPGRETVAQLLKSAGYTTACIGKWHLGFGFGKRRYRDPIHDGPLQHGFDHFFGIAGSLDQAPFDFVHDDRFTELPTATVESAEGFGAAAADFKPIDVMPRLVDRATEYVRAHAPDARQGRPFFLYLAFTSPHAPVVPTPEWQGKSGLNPYADFVMQTDAAVGTVLSAIDEAGLGDDTLLIFASDNGCAPGPAHAHQLEENGHFPSAQFRGFKSDIWDGGNRVPLIVRWPGVVAPGSRCDQMVGLIDTMATLAQVAGSKLPETSAVDSVSLLPILRGMTTAPVREALVFHSIKGNFAIRAGQWKLELCSGSGGWSSPTEPQAAAEKLPRVQLYDMTADEAERHNVEAQHPEVVARLLELLEQYVTRGRSTPGPTQSNDKAIELWKPVRPVTTTGAGERPEPD